MHVLSCDPVQDDVVVAWLVRRRIEQELVEPCGSDVWCTFKYTPVAVDSAFHSSVVKVTHMELARRPSLLCSIPHSVASVSFALFVCSL